MPYEIFTSYSRQAPGICRDVLRILEEQLGYAGAVFVDTEAIPGGSEWAAQIWSTLREVQYILLLATSEAVDNPDFIRKEIAAAREQKPRPDIIPIEFDRDAAKTLLGEGTIQHIKAGRNGDACRDPVDLERRLRLALTQRTKNRHRRDAREWVDGNLPSPSFWESFLPHTGSIAIVAPAGRGKSVIAAHHLQHQLGNPRTWPMVLRPGTVGGDFGELLRSLDAKDLNDLYGQLQTLQEYGHNMILVVDGLDQIRFNDDPEHIRTGDLLQCLSEAANLVVTCRDDVWGTTYGPRLALNVAAVDELAEAEVSRFLPAGAGNRLLRTPFFLDLAIHHQEVWGSMPRTDIDFFRKLFHRVDSNGGGLPDATGRNKRAILQNLAEHQLNELTYEVPRSAVENDLNLPSLEFRRALMGLKDDRLLIERSLTSLLGRNLEPTLRLAHDLLDCFSIADAVFSAADRYAAARSVCERSERECGWSVLAMLVRLAHYYDDDVLLRTVFEEFLATLDRKRFNSSYMARSWAATYVLREQLPILLPLVLEALAGRPVPSLKPDAKQTGSRLGDNPCLTPEAASSVASAFLGLEAGALTDVSRVIPVLSAGLHKWELKGRFIDALARYETDEVRQILLDFGNQMLDSREDLPCLRYVAEGLQRFQPDRLLVSLLERIASQPEVDPVTRRRAYQSLQEHDRRTVPERYDEEIVYGLALRDEKGRPSDWRVVHEYALYVREQVTMRRRQFGPAICSALITSLQHAMTYVRSPVATALGCFDEPMARDALLDQLIENVLPPEIRDACRRALERQYERISDPGGRQTFRLVLLHTAEVVGERHSVSLAHRLSELAMKGAEKDGWLVDPGALQVVPPWPLARPVTIRTVEVRDGPPIEPTLATLIHQFDDLDTGPDLEVKYRFTNITYRTDHSLNISLAPTTWSDSNKFHAALRRDPGATSHDSTGAWIEPIPLGRTALPGIAAVHGIVLTTDDQVLLAQRNTNVGYAPLHWSASFEEQLNEHDFGTDEDPFTHAARRGFYEEFAAEIDPKRISALSALLQLDLLNLGMVMLLRPGLTAAQIEERWINLAQDGWEASQLGWLPRGSLHQLTRWKDFSPLHATSRLRCELLRRWIQENPARHSD